MSSGDVAPKLLKASAFLLGVPVLVLAVGSGLAADSKLLIRFAASLAAILWLTTLSHSMGTLPLNFCRIFAAKFDMGGGEYLPSVRTLAVVLGTTPFPPKLRETGFFPAFSEMEEGTAVAGGKEALTSGRLLAVLVASHASLKSCMGR